MAQELNELIQRLQELNQTARESGNLSPEQLAQEVAKISATIQEALAQVGLEQQEDSPQAAVLLNLFRGQLQTIVEESGLTAQPTEEMNKLREELELLKRSFIQS